MTAGGLPAELALLADLDIPGLDPAALAKQRRMLAPAYDVERWVLPLARWALRRYDHDGATAWEMLRRQVATAPGARPMCVYLHVPFCSSRCRFCDSYSFRVSADHELLMRDYVGRMVTEIELWAALGTLGERPVSTVHLGGGTPTHLGAELLAELCATCRDVLAIDGNTEWALESTVHGLTPDVVAAMTQCGFRRLHLGVQTLQDDVRAAIGRVSAARDVLAAIAAAHDRGWIVSADVVCGLPGQGLVTFAQDLLRLISAGVDGVSLYELLIYPRNRRWAEASGLGARHHLGNYVMFQVGAQLLEAHGYRKNTFNHWATARDDNRYFTFPSRGEDLLAIGALADGVMGDYHYRYPRYSEYMRGRCDAPVLEGGLRRTCRESEIQVLETAVMSGHIPAGLVDRLRLGLVGKPLAQHWIDHGLVEPDGRGLALSTNGSWFVGTMLTELDGLLTTDRRQE
jgi:coproporphyrinogen III oxidase-like Fe-S oxidoreductase